MRRVLWVVLACLAQVAMAAASGSADELAESFTPLVCTGAQAAGFHDHGTSGSEYEPALFHPNTFRLAENQVFAANLGAAAGVDLYLTMTLASGESTDTRELQCRRVRGADGSRGISCMNIPPAEFLLLNTDHLRFTRAAIGGWTFSAALQGEGGDSVFVEFGVCALTRADTTQTASPVP